MTRRRPAGAHQVFVEATRAAMARAERRSAGPACPECREVGATAEESLVIHADPVPDEDQRQAEVDRLMALGYTPATARLAAIPYRAGAGWPEISR